MRYTYGIVDGKKILAYNPQLFRRTDDLLVFPEKEFNKWYNNVTEYIDGLFQINSKRIDNDQHVEIDDLNLATGILCNITEELENIFDPGKPQNSYSYVSTMDEKYKERNRNLYTKQMMRADYRSKPVINKWIKYKHLMELINIANMHLDQKLARPATLPSVQKKLSDLL
jgi:hypothetical protein